MLKIIPFLLKLTIHEGQRRKPALDVFVPSLKMISALLFFLSYSPGSLAGAFDIEDGGAVIKGPANPIRPLVDSLQPLSIGEIPGMSLLLQKFVEMPVDTITKESKITGFLPTQSHFYYRVGADFAQGPGRELVAQYIQLVPMPAQEIRLIHYQELSGILRTFLLPSFFNSGSDLNAAAILLAQGSSSTAQSAAGFQNIQNAAEAYFAKPDDAGNYFNFYSDVFLPDSWAALISACWQYDLSHRSPIFKINGGKQISISDLLGGNFVACWIQHPQDHSFQKCSHQLSPNSSSLLARGLAAFILEKNPDPTLWARIPTFGIQNKLAQETFAKNFYAVLLDSYPPTFVTYEANDPQLELGRLYFESF